jgi:hypothetical protein
MSRADKIYALAVEVSKKYGDKAPDPSILKPEAKPEPKK